MLRSPSYSYFYSELPTSLHGWSSQKQQYVFHRGSEQNGLLLD